MLDDTVGSILSDCCQFLALRDKFIVPYNGMNIFYHDNMNPLVIQGMEVSASWTKIGGSILFEKMESYDPVNVTATVA